MNQGKDKTWIASVFLAITASLCCITPVVALLSGVGGIAATFSFLEPARPYLISVTVLVLGFAWYQKLKPCSKEQIDCACEDEKPSFWQSKKFLGVVTVITIGLLTFPSYSHIFYESKMKLVSVQKSSVAVAQFSVTGMTCTSCEEHVKYTLNNLHGVLESSANYEDGMAYVKFDTTMLQLAKVIDAINATGYKINKYTVESTGK